MSRLRLDRILITPVHPARPGEWFDLVGEPEISGGVGGWGEVERPRRSTAVEWIGTPARIQVLPLGLDTRDPKTGHGTSIEGACRRLEGWGLPTQATGEPPVLKLHGVLYGTDSRWVIDDITWGPALRNGEGRRIAQDFSLTLAEFIEPKVLRGPAAASRKRRR